VLYTPNCIDTPAVTWGCHWAGGIVSPANPLYTADELIFQLKDAGAKALVTHESCLPVALKAAKMVGLVEDRIILIGDISDPQSRLKHFTSIRDTSGTTKYSRPSINPKDDTAFLVYSSGTTGLPKGVILTHMNIVSNSQQLKATEFAALSWRGGPDGQGDKMMGFLPFFHVYGQSYEIIANRSML
jgi:4-coumarate--CoA ligase